MDNDKPQRAINLRLEPKFFKNNRVEEFRKMDAGESQPTPRKSYIFKGIKVPPDGEIHVEWEGLKYPSKGFPFPKAVLANDIVKRDTISMIKVLSLKEIRLPIFAFWILSWKKKKKIIEKLLEQYAESADKVLWFDMDLRHSLYLENRYRTKCSRAIEKFVVDFLKELGIKPELSEKIGDILGNMIEWDDAYRYRFEDVMSETYKYTMRVSLFSELKRLQKILEKRDLMAADKLTPIFSGLRLALIFMPRFKRAFKSALERSEFYDFQLDKIDWYTVMLWEGYNFYGKDIEERKGMWWDLHDGKVPGMINLIS